MRVATKILLWQIIATMVLIILVIIFASKTASDIRASEAKARAQESVRAEAARTAQTASLRAGCARGVARDFEAFGTNTDLAGFARDAAKTRRVSGDRSAASKYDKRAVSAEARVKRIKLRLPKREDEATIAAFCRQLYPSQAPGS